MKRYGKLRLGMLIETRIRQRKCLRTMRMDHAIVEVLNVREVVVEFPLQRACGRQTWHARRHLPRQKIDVLLIERQRVCLAVFIELQPVFDVSQELIGVRET